MDNRINKAVSIYKQLYNTDNKKFKFLPNWLETTSYWFNMEHNNNINKKYKKFSRGSIIYLDFGINIGHEFSGRHFGIVLNKNDSPYNSLVTVVPLSSKNKKHYLPLQNIVFKTSLSILNKTVDNIEFDLDVINHVIFTVIEIINKNNLQNTLEQNTIDYLDDFAIKTRFPTEREVINKSKNIVESFNLYNDPKNFSALFNYLLIDVNDRKSKVNNLREVINKYKKFDKNTFTCTQNVVTISKLRILKINAEDPSGRMKLDFDSMKLVDNEIKNKLIN
ncbi:PemK-like growth inhibitor [Staphylococcus aureus]|uniref:Endoribonuclease MazF n=8 Tax=Staphylococcus TaxID=1279 RepID=A0A7Z7QXB2_STASC|nr:type II toxin-antitoxin system PemK/MazF family toxin [Staphylococcus aureus]SUN30330.1 PemK-like growth inhibitor [Staphylococcus schleiferi]MBU7079874.1 type II toxin-antitoxin system PemK/MazF family toxin [Staphylococcus aureus]MCW1269601.1 type II toxin-antitoxin system PemK/MazF family toxin [Staphylococcus aureus]MCW1280376.1 type II toxin-antitoxin system PemK/MazF family toxin [Staphylococcus aureus]MDV5966763.1 type II toxin-antitoxin system PemK/MazF family toxin [Staphylococcus 